MDQPVKLHIERIQRLIDEFTAEFSSESDLVIRQELESYVRSLRLALAHFQLGIQIEEEVQRSRDKRKR